VVTATRGGRPVTWIGGGGQDPAALARMGVPELRARFLQVRFPGWRYELPGRLGDAKSSLGGAKSSLGDAKSSLGDA
jgi:hypothetical protein